MKNLILLSLVLILSSFNKVDNNLEKNITNSPYICDDNSVAISSLCWSGCVSVVDDFELVGDIDIDSKNLDRNTRKPTLEEYREIQDALSEACYDLIME